MGRRLEAKRWVLDSRCSSCCWDRGWDGWLQPFFVPPVMGQSIQVTFVTDTLITLWETRSQKSARISSLSIYSFFINWNVDKIVRAYILYMLLTAVAGPAWIQKPGTLHRSPRADRMAFWTIGAISRVCLSLPDEWLSWDCNPDTPNHYVSEPLYRILTHPRFFFKSEYREISQ